MPVAPGIPFATACGPVQPPVVESVDTLSSFHVLIEEPGSNTDWAAFRDFPLGMLLRLSFQPSSSQAFPRVYIVFARVFQL